MGPGGGGPGGAGGLEDLAELKPEVARSLGQLRELARERERLMRGAPSPPPREIVDAVADLKLHGCAVDDLGLCFTMSVGGGGDDGATEVELVPGGAEREVSIDNLGEYVERTLRVTLLEGVRAQASAFRRGFCEVFSIDRLGAFTADELDLLLNGAREDVWQVTTTIEQLKFDHGYTRSSAAVVSLLEILSEFSHAEQREFLRFVTGSPRLPVGGLACLSPRLTIVQKRPEGGVSPDAYLPSVMTCANYLKLPDYSTKEVMRSRLLTAVHEGQGAFLLS